MDIEVEVMPPYDADENHLPGKATNFKAVWKLIADYREGYSLLGCAIPTTILRAFFYLLICFEVASVLEITVVPQENRTQQIFIVAAVYTALIIIKTMFEALGIMRNGCAYFDEERNSPGRLLHRIINDSSTLNKIMEAKLDILIPAIICPGTARIAAENVVSVLKESAIDIDNLSEEGQRPVSVVD
ncbi:ABC transporter B member 10 [Parelaphostrongylus tenuis]|uniref:ABC transporter B member 10 n=1 Tax=Parelaphostrongylus tenuis TaxID=148309 RepID=A0AAD5N9C2_PARTN|nr:ABC transporter B member 10 [Parelaphostrongylus tenuis]